MKRKRLGELLIEAGSISREQLNHSLKEQEISEEKLGQILTRLGYITEDILFEFLCNQHGTSGINLYKEVIDERAVEMIPKNVAEEYKVIPVGFKLEEGTKKLTVAMADSSDLETVGIVEFITGYSAAPIFASESQLERIIRYYYFNMEAIGFYDELEQRNEDLKIITSLIQAVHKSFSLEEIYGVALDSVVKLENIDMMMIYLVDEEKHEAVLQAHRNLPEDYVRRAGRIPYPKGITWKVINTGRIMNIEDAQKDPDTGPAGRDLGHHSNLGIPIFLEEKVIGVIWFGSYKEHKFNQREIDLLSTLGDQIAIAISRAKQTEELEERNRNLSILSAISQAVHQSVDLDQVYRIVLDVTKDLRFIDIVGVYLVEGEGDKREAVLQVQWGYTEEYLKRASRIPYPRGNTWNVIENGESVYYEDASDPSTPIGPAGKALGKRSLLSIPIKSGDEIIGVVDFSSFTKRRFSNQELNVLLSLGNQIGTAIAKAKTFKALLRSEGQYRTLVETARDVIFTLSTDGTITSLNPAFETITGWSRAEWLGKPFAPIIHPDDLFFAMALFQRGMQGEETSIFELRVLSKSGEYLTAEFTATLEVQDGKVVRVLSIARDITERKRTEEVLRESLAQVSKKNRYETIISAVIQAVHQSINLQEVLENAVESMSKNINKVNNVAIYFVEGEEAILKTCRGFPDWYVKRAGRVSYPKGVTWKTIIEGKPRYCADVDQDTAIGPAGREMGIKSYLSMPVSFKDKTVGTLNISSFQRNAFDEEELKLLEIVAQQIEIAINNAQIAEALRQSEERYRTLFDQSPVGVYIFDKEFKITQCNERMVQILQSSYDKIIGLGMRNLKDQGFMPAMEKVFENQFSHQESFYEATTSPTKLWLSVCLSPLRDANGNIVGGMGVVEDITERKRMEEEFLRTQKLESVGVLAGGIAHDFNNLLTAILGNVSLTKMYASLEDKTYKRLTEAEKACLRAKDLTQQLLTFSKGGTPVKKLTSIGELIKDSVNFAVCGSNVRCEFSVAEDLWMVEVDEGQISQVINNLVINAHQAMPQGGVIRVRVENVSVRVGDGLPMKEGRYAKITVEDKGIGIPQEHLVKIFDPYFTTKQKGNGLGLATAYSIIKSHDGCIEVESEVGVGTKFYIYIPASQKEILAKKDTIEERTVVGRGRILVMDDEEVVRGVAGEILRHLGYEVEFARDGREAIELYRRARESGNPFDVVIMDLTIPGSMGGREAIKRLIEIDPNVKAIVSSGYSNSPVMAKYTKYGFREVITKPYGIEELSEILAKVINEK